MPKVEATPQPCGVDGTGYDFVHITDKSRAEVESAIDTLTSSDDVNILLNLSDGENPLTVVCSPPGVAIAALREQLSGPFRPEDYTSLD